MAACVLALAAAVTSHATWANATTRLEASDLDHLTAGRLASGPATTIRVPGRSFGGGFGVIPAGAGGGLAPTAVGGASGFSPFFFGPPGGSDDVSASQASSTSTNP